MDAGKLIASRTVSARGAATMSFRRRILILGGSGRLGGALGRRYGREHELQCPPSSELDLRNPDGLASHLRDLSFDVLINCAAITSPDICEERTLDAKRVNTDSACIMAAECQRRGARMIHISTDYVFSGEGDAPLQEDDHAFPVNVYGHTKLAAEHGVLRSCPTALVARVSWLFGPDKPAFPETVLGHARAGRDVLAIDDKWSTPCYTEDLAVWLERLFTDRMDVSGPLHACNSGIATWLEYAQAVLDVAFEIGLLDRPVIAQGHTMTGFAHFKARRPRYTPLANDRLSQVIGENIRPWQAALRDHLQRM